MEVKDVEKKKGFMMASSDHERSLSLCPSGFSGEICDAQTTQPGKSTVRSPMWNYFTWEESTGKSVCQVTGADGNVCSQNITGKYTTNLKYHIKNKRPKEYSTILAIESTLKKAKEEAEAKRAISHKASVTAAKQLTLTESLSATKQYRKESEKYQSITRKLAIFVGSNNVANSIVESAEFKEFILLTQDTKYLVGKLSIKKWKRS